MIIDEEYVHGGNADNCIHSDMSVNVNPCRIPESVKAAINAAVERADRYPDPYCSELVDIISEKYNVRKPHIVCGNGADELIYNYASAIAVQGKNAKALIYEPSFAEYERSLSANGVEVAHHILSEKNEFEICDDDVIEDEIKSSDAIYLCMPSNPAGKMIAKNTLERILDICKCHGTRCFLDMCFYELTEQYSASYVSGLLEKYNILTCLFAYTKTFAIPGVRLGYLISGDEKLARRIREFQPMWNVSSLAQAAGVACEKSGGYLEASVKLIAGERHFLEEQLEKCVDRVHGSAANYILFYDNRISAKKLAERGIKLRGCSDYHGLGKGYYRTCVGTHEENEELISAICDVKGIICENNKDSECVEKQVDDDIDSRHSCEKKMQKIGNITDDREISSLDNYISKTTSYANVEDEKGSNQDIKKQENRSHTARNIMIQGTMSNAGKSLLCAALCRIFKQDGYRVAPFKSQNMALNSYITKDGLEMGRAQVVQAEAAGVEPSVYMNPVLLKPTTDVGSQVIVNGKSIGNMKAAEYFKYKKKLVPDIMEAYDRLARDNDIIIIEGAGSPAEINLKSEDIVNMGLARMVDAPVLLVGDIDLGGVFAQLYGTVSLLEKDEADRIKGYVINKFRGDVSLLKDGTDQMSDMLGKPCLGVVPYMHIDIDDEDSLSSRIDTRNGRTDEYRGDIENSENSESSRNSEKLGAPVIDIVVIRLPRMSNYTDYNALARHDGVRVRYVDRACDIAEPDAVIIPGTKSTMEDMRWLRESGIECEIKKLSAEGLPVIGICGGLQMLGRSITDRTGAEGKGSITGMELLPLDTEFSEEKVTTQRTVTISGLTGIYSHFNEARVHGYEMHMGVSGVENPFVQNKNVLATYIHGCFDDGLDDKLIQMLCERKGIDYDRCAYLSYAAYRQAQYDRLADIVRESLDMDKIRSIIGL